MSPLADFDASSVLHMLSAHEERIQRLENVTSELASSVAEQNATMRSFSQQMRMMSDSVCEKLDDVSTRLSDKMAQIADISKEMSVDAKQQAERLAKLEADEAQQEKKSAKLSDFWWKIVYFAVTSSVGAGATLLVQWLKK